MNVIECIRRWRKPLYFIGVLLGLVLFLYQLWKASAIIKQYSNYSWISIFSVATIIIVIAYGLQILAWMQLMESFGYSIKMMPAIKGYITSFIPRYIPGTIWGYWSRNEWLLKEFQIPYAVSSRGSVLEIITGVITASIASIYIVAQYININVGYILFAGILLIIVGYFFSWKFGLVNVRDLHVFRFMAAVILYLVFWIVYGVTLLWFLTQLTGTDANFLYLTSMYSLAWLIGFLFVVTPSGLGVREFVLATLLTKQVLLSGNEASAIALSMRFAIYLAEIFLLIIWADKQPVLRAVRRRFF